MTDVTIGETLRLRVSGSSSRSAGQEVHGRGTRSYSLLIVALLILVWGGELHPCRGESAYVEDFESTKPTWKVAESPRRGEVLEQVRQGTLYYGGKSAELIRIKSPAAQEQFRFEYPFPAARGVDGMKASVWCRGESLSVLLGLRLVFPRQIDAETGIPLTTVIEGEATELAGGWKPVEVELSQKAMNARFRLLRKRLERFLKTDIDRRDWYVDQVSLTLIVPEDESRVVIDDFRLQPYVKRPGSGEIQRINLETSNARTFSTPQLDVRLDRLLMDDHPCFLRFLPYQGEKPDVLKEMGMNAVWIPDLHRTELISTLARKEFLLMGTPPSVRDPEGQRLSADQAGMLPFPAEYDAISCWMLGNGITAGERRQVASWVDQITAADRQKRPGQRTRRKSRPLLADITGAERNYSRIIPLLGMSRMPQHSAFSPDVYRDWLLARHKQSRPGSFLWTWIQTAPHPELQRYRTGSATSPLRLQYEQVRLQMYSALAAGCRGLGFWSTKSLEEKTPEGEEVRLSLKQLNLEMSLIEEWLATAELLGHTPIRIDSGKPAHPPGSTSEARQNREVPGSNDVLETAVFKTSYGMLLIPIWYDRYGQFVPGGMMADGLEFVIKGGIAEAAQVWEVTTTDVHTLESHPVAGGTRIRLGNIHGRAPFNMTSLIVVPQDQQALDRLRKKIEQIAPESAAAVVELARLKFEGTEVVTRELASMGDTYPQAARLLQQAKTQVDSARQALEQQNYRAARVSGEMACQTLRILQRGHWETAVHHLSHPMSSPHAISFHSLPDHWRLIRQFGASRNPSGENLLASGSFDLADQFLKSGWEHVQSQILGVHGGAELLRTTDREGSYVLKLHAEADQRSPLPDILSEIPVTVTTPTVSVKPGYVIHVSGRVRVVSTPQRTFDGVSVVDSAGGSTLGLHWTEQSGWQHFQMIRTARSEGSFSLDLNLHGLGEVWFDDLKIITQPPVIEQHQQLASPSPGRPKSSLNPWQLLEHVPGLKTWTGMANEKPQPSGGSGPPEPGWQGHSKAPTLQPPE